MSERNGKLFRRLAFRTGTSKKVLRRAWMKFDHRMRAIVRRAWASGQVKYVEVKK